jgi:hypothetical protein
LGGVGRSARCLLIAAGFNLANPELVDRVFLDGRARCENENMCRSALGQLALHEQQ